MPRPLEYAYVMRRRPAVVTAVGVMSVIVGLATLFACVLSLLGAGAVYRLKVALASAPPVTFTAVPTTSPATAPAAPPAAAPTTLPTTDVQAALAAVQQHAGTTPLNPSQISALQRLLDTPGQMLVLPTPTTPAANYVFGAQVDDDGTAHVVFMHFIVSVSAQGQVLATQATGAIPGNIVGQISGAAAALAMAESVIGAALAMFLLLAGVQTLRQSLGARKLHWIYVAIKVPLSIVGIVAWAWLLHGLTRGMRSMPLMASSVAPTGFFTALVYVALSLGVAGLVYPIALVFALRGRQANAYYNMVT